MLSSLATSLVLLTVALAAPTPDNGYCYPSRENKVAQYDDLPWVEGQRNPIPTPYLGLDYNIFQVDRNDGFIPPTSGDQWTMAFGGSGNISVPDRYATTRLSPSYILDSSLTHLQVPRNSPSIYTPSPTPATLASHNPNAQSVSGASRPMAASHTALSPSLLLLRVMSLRISK